MTNIAGRLSGFLLAVGMVVFAAAGGAKPIDLSGSWQFRLGAEAEARTLAPPSAPMEIPAEFDDTIRLPGTTDTNHKGEKVKGSTKGTYTRRFRFVGRAWYRRTVTIPPDWKGRDVEMFLERALWKTTVFLDGEKLGDCDSLATPHVYNLGQPSPGEHVLTICVDNSMIHNIGDKGHAYSENMQTVWNGLLGRLELRPLSGVRIKAVRSLMAPKGDAPGSLLILLENASDRLAPAEVSVTLATPLMLGKTASTKITLKPGTHMVACPLPGPVDRWDEFSQPLYDTKVTVRAGDESATWSGKLGFATPGSDGTHITINSRPVFLRGNLDNCHFPLTGYPPLDKAGWLKVWNIYKQFGLNHVRFHSWCPPEAAFAAADEAGIYMQAEAGVWIDGWMKGRVASKPDGISDKNPAVRDFVAREMKRIVDAYGHHPSFVMMCIGNELGSSDFKVLGRLVTETREYDGTRRLYSCSTARMLQPGIDNFFVSHKNPAGGMRGLRGPRTDWNYDNVKRGAPDTPLILHELGQWPISPDWREIDKYSGVVEARNLMMFRQRAEENHVAAQNRAFQKATGEFSTLLYKAEMEGALRSKTYTGFHMLGLQDYMGQGEALIGVLDMFYDLKPGVITPDAYRQFCAPVVPLAGFPKYTWTSGETFTAAAQVSNFSASDMKQPVDWKLTAKDGAVLGKGRFQMAMPQGAVTDLGEIKAELNTEVPLACTLEIGIEGTPWRNTWPIWVYPAKKVPDQPKDVIVTGKLDDKTLSALESGASVVLIGAGSLNAKVARPNRFIPVYWSMGWFPGQKKTLGLLCDTDHPLFRLFPTEDHCDWQWNDIVNSSKAMIINDLPADFRPIAQPVDDFHRSDKLGAIFEFRVGRGKILVCLYPLKERIESAACRQLYTAVLGYAASRDFHPETEIPMDWLKRNFRAAPEAKSPAKNPVGGAPATLWVRVADKMKPTRQNVRHAPTLDVIKKQADGYGYRLSADGAWKDDGGAFVFGKEIKLRLNVPKGVEGTLYVRFNDWNNNKRVGRLVFEGRASSLGPHTGRNGRWIEFDVMREDALDNTLELEAEVTSGPNLQIDELLFVPK